jgi:hypothetical protein
MGEIEKPSKRWGDAFLGSPRVKKVYRCFRRKRLLLVEARGTVFNTSPGFLTVFSKPTKQMESA